MAVTAKVAEVLPPYEVVISAGSDQGVRKGDLAIIYRYLPIEDPDSGDDLGALRRRVVRLRVFDVEPRFSVARTLQPANPSTSLATPRRRVTSRPSETDRYTLFVKIGDEVDISRRKATP